MTEQIEIQNGVVFVSPEASDNVVALPTATPVKTYKRAKPRDTGEATIDFLLVAKKAVVENYNEHRNEELLPAITVDMVAITWFSKALGNWKAALASPVAKGLLWEVSYNSARNELYLDVYKKIKNTIKISQEA